MFISNKIKFLVTSFYLLVFAFGTLAAVSFDGLWREIDDSALSRRPMARTRTPENYKTFELNKRLLSEILADAPEEFTANAVETVIELPTPDGKLERFRIEHSLVVERGLLKEYPELGLTYRGQGIDDPAATVRMDFLPSGFHAIILSPGGTTMIDPYAIGDTDNYVAYYKSDLPRMQNFECLVGRKGFYTLTNFESLESNAFFSGAPPEVTSGTQLRTYRLALAATNEYATAVGSNTVAGTLAAQVLIMNRVNGVYERDLAIHMNMIANNNLIVYAGDNMTCGGGSNQACTAANDPYSNSNGIAMLSENQAKVDAVIGTANYDIGHVFSTGGGGVANLSGACSGSSKARGVTGQGNPVGDAFAIDYVAHEMGHQWGADHTFNGVTGSCSGGNRSAANAFEPGSGITIMAYAGICGTQDLAPNSIDTFHVRSLEAIVAFSQTGNGNTCAVTTASGNTPPTVPVVGGPYNIPKQTPFVLNAFSTDANGDSITYDWQEYDLGPSTTAVPNTDAGGAMPIFRPYLPTVGGNRYFPSLPFILNNANVPPATTGGFLTGELLPAISRTMNFQVIARDNRANAGGINTATAVVNVDGNSGPFVITAPNTAVTWPANSSQIIRWNVANTAAAPVSAANVKISFSTDGGQTFPTTLAASTPNDGTEIITVPNILTGTARIKVEAVGNIFFDISDVNFTVTAAGNTIPVTIQTSPEGRSFSVDGTPFTAIQVFNWTPGSSHTIATTTPQAGVAGTTYNFTGWSDAGAISHAVAPSAAAAYTANFATVSCSYSLSPASQNFPVGGGVNFVSVITQPGCGWTALSNSLVETGGSTSITRVVGLGSDAIAATFPGTGVGQIPDSPNNGPQAPGTPLDISFAVTGITGAPANVEVSMAATHSWLGDLKATLIAPNGASFTVFGYTGATSVTAFGSDSSLNGTYNFKDGAAGTNWWTAATTTPVPPGDYRTTVSGPTTNPAAVTNFTAAFSGVTNANGTWILRTTDGAGGDTGSITAASLTLTSSAPPPWITITAGQSGTGNGIVDYSVAANATGNPRSGTMTIAGQTFTVNQSNTTAVFAKPFDFDGDGKTDLSIFRPAVGEWWFLRSSNGSNGAVQFGNSTDKLVPADFTGDGRTDVAFWRPSTGQWFILRSEDLSFFAFPFGSVNDVPVPADYDGDGKADAAVFRPSTLTWYINKSSGGTDTVGFGAAGDKPVVGDYDGDGKADIAIFRPTGATGSEWWIRRSSTGSVVATAFGVSTDKPVPGDFTGDGKTDVAFWRPSTGNWYVLRSEDFSFFAFPFGSPGDIASPGDYDGDGKIDSAVFRPSNSTWYVNRSNGSGTLIQGFGQASDVPVPSAYVP